MVVFMGINCAPNRLKPGSRLMYTATMPALLQWSETTGCGATIKLDNGDVVYVSIAGSRVMIRLWNLRNLPNAVFSRFFGPKLYNERNATKNARMAGAFGVMFPDHEPALPLFQNRVLGLFVNAIWHCGSAGELLDVLAKADARATE
jgi:hypothetical protein